MGRVARSFSRSGFYHIVFRGISFQHLFEEEDDYIFFMNIIKRLKEAMVFELHSYCLMSNHVHILIKEARLGDISLIMKRLLTKYAMYFNRKYKRSGTLIASRYKSSPVEIDEYFMPLIRYIHQNPVRAKMAEKPEDYKFSSYKDYMSRENGITDTEFALSIMKKDEFIAFHAIVEEQKFIVTGKKLLTEEEVHCRIKKHIDDSNVHNVVAWPKEKRNELISILKKDEGLSIRQIERATGISRGIIAKI